MIPLRTFYKLGSIKLQCSRGTKSETEMIKRNWAGLPACLLGIVFIPNAKIIRLEK